MNVSVETIESKHEERVGLSIHDAVVKTDGRLMGWVVKLKGGTVLKGHQWMAHLWQDPEWKIPDGAYVKCTTLTKAEAIEWLTVNYAEHAKANVLRALDKP